MKKKTLLKVLPVVAAASFAFGGFSLAGCSGESVQVIEEKIEDIQITDNAIEAPYKDDASENVQKQIDDLKAGKTYTSSDPLVMYNPYGTLGLSLYVYFQTEEDAKVSYNISVPDENIPDFGGDLEGGATDAAGANLDAGGDVGEGFLPDLEAILFGAVGDDVDCIVENAIGDGLFATHHEVVDKLGDEDVIVFGIREDDSFLGLSFSHVAGKL